MVGCRVQFVNCALRILFALLLLGPSVEAKDLANRLGVGYANQFGVSGDLPSLAVRYYPSLDVGVAAQLGVDTQKDASKFGFMGKVFRIIFMEDNMNFYMGAGGGLISQEIAGENDSGFELNGFIGGEYFFSGLDSLGFSFEAGVGVTSVNSEVRFRTIGDHPLRAGIVFYF